MRRLASDILIDAALVLALSWPAASARAQAPAAVSITISAGAKAGSTTISGFVTPAGTVARRVVVEVNAGQGGVLGDRVSTARIDLDTGKYTVTLSQALRAGNQVVALLLNGTDGVIARATPAAVPQPQRIVLPVPSLSAPAREGTRMLSGTIQRTSDVALKDLASIVAVVFGQETEQESTTATDQKAVRRTDIASTSQISENGLFAVTLTRPVIAGQRIELIAHTEDDESAPAVYTVEDFGDWGRLRAYLAGGVVFSKENGDFSEQDLALTFAMDKTWLQSDNEWLTAKRNRHADHGRFRPREFHTFFDTRLTALPVLESKKGESDQPFVTSKKAALLQAGLYLPIYGRATTWTHQGAPNALFISPLLKAGVVTINGDSSSSEGDRFGGDDVFSYWAFGFGLGHYKLSGTADRASELISYMHVTAGRYENFEIRPDKNNPDVRETPFRLALEGRLKIPETALQVGVDANLGKGKDDIRFIFGTRFDIGELFGKLKSLSPVQ